MPQITLEQALFHRPDEQAPRCLAQSAGFDPAWLPLAEQLILGFGERRPGVRCPLTVFAKPLMNRHIAVVRVRDEPTERFPTVMCFHVLVVDKKSYEGFIRDPFMLAEKVEPTWEAQGTLPAVILEQEAFAPRTLAQ